MTWNWRQATIEITAVGGKVPTAKLTETRYAGFGFLIDDDYEYRCEIIGRTYSQ